MAPDARTGNESCDGSNQASVPDTSAAEAALKARLSRKRTKTGCLTCRKRRIKCGEERPICKNCIKSKRHCEGYNQRVVFKPPTFDYRPVANGGAHITFQAGPMTGPGTAYGVDVAYQPFAQMPYGDLRPRPPDGLGMTADATFDTHQQSMQHPFQQLPMHPHDFPLAPSHPQGFQAQSPHVLPSNGGFAHSVPITPTTQYELLQHTTPDTPTTADGFHSTSAEHVRMPQAVQPQFAARSALQMQSWSHQSTPVMSQQPWSTANISSTNGTHGLSPSSNRSSIAVPSHQPLRVSELEATWTPNSRIPLTEAASLEHPALNGAPDCPKTFSEASTESLQPSLINSGLGVYGYDSKIPFNLSPNQILSNAAIEAQDDDYFDVESAEEMDVDASNAMAQDAERQQTLGNMLQRNHISVQDLHTRRYDTFIYEGMMDHYRVERVANPLRNPATARVFAHFIAVTGPSLSIFERHPRNTSVLFNEGQVPVSQRGLWTYTMPMAALHHQGLLHAMLALASLHIAKLTGASATPSIQHYAWALKKIHHCVGHPKKRLKVCTIAASLLLGFYEIMTADHMKWNMHLAGSKQLFVETDFVRMTRQFKKMKQESKARHVGSYNKSESPPGVSQDDLLAQIPDIDERMISHLIGRGVRYGDHGEIMTPESEPPQKLDLSKFEILKDLYWWYCKQDVYQSLVSGNPLLMDYSRWADCPPRAPLGRPRAVYGSFDHLILLLARIADFTCRDRTRKLKQMELNGGQWKPPPGRRMPPTGPPTAQVPVTPLSAHPLRGANAVAMPHQMPPHMPAFYGMAPPPRHDIQMPASYGPSNGMPTSQSPPVQEPVDMQAATQAALEEYGRIRAALHIFSTSLGPAFQALTADEQPPHETPFGPALFYRSYDIGCLWAIYNMAVIIAIRSHPHMPPAAHMAASIAAQETVHFANEIGRIAAGIVPDSPDQALNPSLGSALCESCMPSFFAAVQYTDAAQRHTTVARMFSIAQRTGWGSAELIANGCETAWVKSAAAGRGPAYQRIGRRSQSDDPRLNGSWERLDMNALPDERDEADRRLVRKSERARLNWGIGVIGTEDDM